MNVVSLQDSRISGKSLVDILVVVAVLLVGAGMLLPLLGNRAKKGRRDAACYFNLREIGTAFRIFAYDFDGAFPYQVLSRSTNALAETWPLATGFNKHDPTELWKVYLAAENELGSPRILVCRWDDKTSATTFTEGPTDSTNRFDHPTRRLNALSYFYGLNATDSEPNLFVAGDRNFTTDGTDTDPGKTLLTGQAKLSDWSASSQGQTAPRLRWSSTIHEHGGNVVFSDGSVQQLTSGKLRDAVAKTRATNTVVWLPNLPASLK